MTRQVRKPRNIDYEQSARLQSRALTAGIDLPPGWELFVTASTCGRARVNSKTVTVPLWATIKDGEGKASADYELYYVAHEAAHAWNYHVNENVCDHNDAFYGFFKQYCPPALWHHELNYKKTAPKRAGISADPATNVNNAGEVPPVIQGYAMAAGPALDVATIRADAIAPDPRLKEKLANVRDDEVRSYVRGWFQL